MAISSKNSRPIWVAGMSFRWRQSATEAAFTVWHVLDEGVLTVRLPVYEPIRSPRVVAGVVEEALATGWRTHEHRNQVLGLEHYRLLTGLAPHLRVGADRVERESKSLNVPSMRGPTGLQVVMLPAEQPSLAISAWLEGEHARVQVGGVDRGVVGRWLGHVDRPAYEDAWVSAVATEPLPAESPWIPRCWGRVTVVQPDGVWEEEADLAVAGGRAREAAVRLWRLAFSAEGLGEARAVLERVHAVLAPEDVPMVVDGSARRVLLFGRWEADVLAERLAALTGVWVIDAKGVAAIDGPKRRLNRLLSARRSQWVFLGTERLLVGEWGLHLRVTFEVERAWRLIEEGAHEVLEATILELFDARWVARAGELLSHRRRAIRREALGELGRWLGSRWSPNQSVTIEGFWFTDGYGGWRDGVPEAGLVVRADRAWAVVDGVVWEAVRRDIR